MILESYFDDSSDPQRREFRACGGLIASPDQWDIFEALWSDATHGLKEAFRSTDCESGHGQFKNWSKPERDSLMAKLVWVLCKADLMGFAGIVPVAEYEKAFPQCGKDDSYFLALRQVMMNVAYVTHKLGHQGNVWFEKGSYPGETHKIFNAICAFKSWSPSRSLRGLYFDTKKLRPLQAADLVAREAFKHIKNIGKRPTRRPVQRMRGNLCFMLWNAKTLAHIADNGGAENLLTLIQLDEKAPYLAHHVYSKK